MIGGALVFFLLSLSIPVCAQARQPSVTSSAVDSKDASRKDSPKSETKPNSPRAAIVIPPEKANPVSIPRFETPPVIDGKLDEEIWKQARVFKDFYQTQPGDNIAPSKKTEVMIGYDSKNLYFAFHAYDDPEKIRATIATRDGVFGEDNVRVFLDTFNDKRKAYVLGFNPFGIQQDGVMTEGGQTDFNVDIVMESKGNVTADGYVIEVAVPFKSLRYEAGKGKLWGIHLWRNITRLDDEVNSWMPLSRNQAGNLNQAGHITGLENISTERTLEITPTLTISEEGRRVRALPLAVVESDPLAQDPGRFINKNAKLDPGLTVKLGITPNVTLDFAANPDFAQVEADQTVVTANQRFPIFFAEKRPFFLEGADIFRTPIQAVHTRAIVDPDYAVKLSGKQGRNTFGLLLATDNAPGNFSEEEINDPDIFSGISKFVNKNAYVGVLRLKRDIGRESSLGLIATSYNFIENHNQLGGIDGRFTLDRQTVFTFQVLGTTSRRFFFDPDLGDSLYRTGNAIAYNASYDFTSRNYGYFIQAQGRTRDYRADVGFVPRTNTNSNAVYFRFSTDPKPKATLISTRLTTGVSTNYDWQGHSQELEYSTNLSFTMTKQTFIGIGYSDFYERLFEEEFGARRSITQAGAFFGDSERSTHGRAVSAHMSTNPSKKYSAFLFVGHRWNIFDFDFGAGPRYPRVSPAALIDPNAPLDPGAANTFDVNASFSYRPTDAMSASFDYNRNRFTRNETGRTVFVDNIYSLNATYQFTRFMFARGRLDYDTLASRLRGQFLFGLTPSPGTSFYVGYNDDTNYNGFSPFTGQSERGFRRNGRTFFIKTSYLIRRSL